MAADTMSAPYDIFADIRCVASYAASPAKLSYKAYFSRDARTAFGRLENFTTEHRRLYAAGQLLRHRSARLRHDISRPFISLASAIGLRTFFISYSLDITHEIINSFFQYKIEKASRRVFDAQCLAISQYAAPAHSIESIFDAALFSRVTVLSAQQLHYNETITASLHSRQRQSVLRTMGFAPERPPRRDIDY